MEKYDGYSKSDFPSFSEYEAWLGADLMIKGLQLAGTNPTRAGVIKALRGVKSYNANGLLPQSLDYATDFGHDDAQELRLDDAGRQDRLHAVSVPAVLRDRHPGDVDGQRVLIG